MPEKMQELQEHAEHAAHEPSLAPVTVTMAILAVLVAAVSLLGHRADTEELLLQTKATDQWAFYQAKDIRRRSYEVLLDEIPLFTVQNPAQAQQIRDKYKSEVALYAKQQSDIEAEARKAEQEVFIQQRRADRFDLGEVIIEAALVICSITLLTRKRFFWRLGVVLGFAGLAISAAGLLIR
ncbi:MAG TPA: DUF4337 domain-containing protein [Candidatus Acidoferrales bacterium]|nr:DUF4337 domain-containing protein [Candidatus Acidoferrales bacterium]